MHQQGIINELIYGYTMIIDLDCNFILILFKISKTMH